jgi:hypothetical protein
MGEICSRHEKDKKSVQNIINLDPEWKSILGRPSRRWRDNIKLDIKVVVCEGVDRIHLAKDVGFSWALFNPVVYIWVL